MRRSLRLRVGGLVLRVDAARPTRLLRPPRLFEPFLAARGGDIHLDLVEQDPPRPTGEPLFESGGVWRVHAHGDGLLYLFGRRGRRPYKGVAVDAALTRGTLYFPEPATGPRPRYALDFPLDELLFQHRLARDGGFEVHACGLVERGRALLFCGQSGAGKSTTARLWSRRRPGTLVLSDDRIVLRPGPGGVRAWGTPWHGEAGFAAPESRPLAAVFFLEHAAVSRAERVGRAEAAARLLVRGFPPAWDAEAIARSIETCDTLARRVPCYRLPFRRDQTAIDVASRAVRAGL